MAGHRPACTRQRLARQRAAWRPTHPLGLNDLAPQAAARRACPGKTSRSCISRLAIATQDRPRGHRDSCASQTRQGTALHANWDVTEMQTLDLSAALGVRCRCRPGCPAAAAPGAGWLSACPGAARARQANRVRDTAFLRLSCGQRTVAMPAPHQQLKLRISGGLAVRLHRTKGSAVSMGFEL